MKCRNEFGRGLVYSLWLLLFFAGSFCVLAGEKNPVFVRVSPRDPRYFELSDGRPYIPIGLNLISPGGSSEGDPLPGLRRMAGWMKELSANGGNYFRVWLSSPFWEVEPKQAGIYEEDQAKRIDALLEMAGQYGLKVKMTLEHFRTIEGSPQQFWAHRPLRHISQGGLAKSLPDFFAGEASRDQFKHKLAWFAERYGDNPNIFGWELWNEVNAVATSEQYYLPWTKVMLAELHRLFPKNLAMQSLGSFDTARVRDLNRRLSRMPGNDVAQVHRYLDPGAYLSVCQEPMDVLAADAVLELRSFRAGRPILLAESGAVESRHSGPFKYYLKDKAGILLHDVLFAPFFAGAAGAGQIWHWDYYVERNQLWYHFGRFAEAVKDLDPPAEAFQARDLKHERMRIYVLKGKQTILLWCRDKLNNWETELTEGKAPEVLAGLKLDLAKVLGARQPKQAASYDPWQNQWQDLELEDGSITLPDFSRSIVVRLKN